MKYIILLILLLSTSCRQYFVELSDLTLSGKYVVSKLEVTSVDQNTSQDSLYSLGSTYINTEFGDPFDTIPINRFYIHFDYSTVSFGLLGVSPFGQDVWEYKNIFYNVWFNNSFYLGTLQFDYITKNGETRRMVFCIEDDGFENLQLKSSGGWINGELGEKRVMTLYLTRVGP
jgi:hypothetical protein